jgi:1,4-dihydroxy-2-naphthoate octaprenyltransferase
MARIKFMADSKILMWINCARPKTLAASVAPVIVGSAMAYSAGPMDCLVLAVTFVSAVLIQVGTNFANDYFDDIRGADTEGRVGPIREIHTGLVSPAQMKKAFIIAFGLAVLAGGFLVFKGGLPILIIGIASVISGYLYTGGPYPLAYVGLGDLFVVLFFGPVATAGTYYLQRGGIDSSVVIAGLGPGLMTTAILAVNNFRDYHEDKAVNKKTLVVRLGHSFGIYEYAFCVLAAIAVPVYLTIVSPGHAFCLISLLTLFPAVKMIRTIASRPAPEVLNDLLANTGKLVVIFSLLFSIGWLL